MMSNFLVLQQITYRVLHWIEEEDERNDNHDTYDLLGMPGFVADTNTIQIA